MTASWWPSWLRETGQVLASSGRVHEALARFDAARAGLSELGLPLELIGLDAALADCLTDAGDLDRAISVANEAVARAEELHAESLLAAVHRVRGRALLAAGREDDARAAFDAGLRCPDGGFGRHEYALNLLGLARLAERHGQPDAARLLSEGNRILDALGVVATPPAPQRLIRCFPAHRGRTAGPVGGLPRCRGGFAHSRCRMCCRRRRAPRPWSCTVPRQG